jgi:hypothetical protein
LYSFICYLCGDSLAATVGWLKGCEQSVNISDLVTPISYRLIAILRLTEDLCKFILPRPLFGLFVALHLHWGKLSLFHCHMQLHMDFGFMALLIVRNQFNYAKIIVL